MIESDVGWMAVGALMGALNGWIVGGPLLALWRRLRRGR